MGLGPVQDNLGRWVVRYWFFRLPVLVRPCKNHVEFTYEKMRRMTHDILKTKQGLKDHVEINLGQKNKKTDVGLFYPYLSLYHLRFSEVKVKSLSKRFILLHGV